MFSSVNLAYAELAAGMLIRGAQPVVNWEDWFTVFAVGKMEED